MTENSFPAGGPLAGVRVVDLTSVVSGPMTTVLLADQGAEVIKVEQPSGDISRRGRKYAGAHPPIFVACNRGKRSVALDLKQDAARQVLWKLLETADVVVQNNRPGAMARLGFDADAVLARLPRIIYASISGVGEQGPYAAKRVYDPIVQALSGVADIQSDPLTGRPRMVRTIVADKITSVYAAQAIAAALYHRERTGKGQHIQLAMLDALVSFIWAEGMAPFAAIGHEDFEATNAPHDMIFETRDGFITVGAVSDNEWQGLCRALSRPEWITDPRFLTNADRSKNRQERLELVESELKARDSETLLEAFDRHDVPCAPVLKRAEMIGHAQVEANGLIVELSQPGVGAMRQARPAVRFSDSPATIRGPAPNVGEATTRVLRELGLSEQDIAALVETGAAKVD